MGYSKEKLEELKRMDEISYQHFYKDGPQPNWTQQQWDELRMYQSRLLSQQARDGMRAVKQLTPQQKARQEAKLQKLFEEAKKEVKNKEEWDV